MSVSEWQIDGHHVRLKIGWFGAKIAVNRNVIFERRVVGRHGFVHRFEIGETACVIRATSRGLSFRYELLTGVDAMKILALEDDGVLRVYELPEVAVQAVEGLDAEGTFRAVFDEQGQPYVIEWLTPNSYSRRIFGIGACGSGEYRLVPCGPPNETALLQAIRSAVSVSPASAEPAVRALEQRLAQS